VQSLNTNAETTVRRQLDNLPAGMYALRATGRKAATEWIQTVRFVKR